MFPMMELVGSSTLWKAEDFKYSCMISLIIVVSLLLLRLPGGGQLIGGLRMKYGFIVSQIMGLGTAEPLDASGRASDLL